MVRCGIVRSIIGVYIYIFIYLLYPLIAFCSLYDVACVWNCGFVCVCVFIFWAVFDTFLGSLITI